MSFSFKKATSLSKLFAKFGRVKKLKRRIYGVENEYSFYARPCQTASDEAVLARKFLDNLPYLVSEQKNPTYLKWHWGEGWDMLKNQARAYLDTGVHPEYATQECDNIFDLIACEKAGEKLFGKALSRLSQKLPRFSFKLYKNNEAPLSDYDLKTIPGLNATFAEHDNYLIEDSVKKVDMAFLIPHLIALNYFCGSGKIKYDPAGRTFNFFRSQRPSFLTTTIYGLSNQDNRPFILWRDEGFPITAFDKENKEFRICRRIQVTSNDANLFPAAILLKHSTTAAMLTMIEDAEFKKTELDPHFYKLNWIWSDKNFLTAIKAANTGGLDDLLPLSDCRWTLRSLIRFFAELRQKYAEKRGFPPDISRGLELEKELIEQTENLSEEEISAAISDSSDWAFMKKIVEADMERQGYNYQSAPSQIITISVPGRPAVEMSVVSRIQYLELLCREINPGFNLVEKAEKIGKIKKIEEVTDERVKFFMENPPRTTRAHRRKIIADELNRRNREFDARWGRILIKKFPEKTGPKNEICFFLNDPFAADLTRSDQELLKEL